MTVRRLLGGALLVGLAASTLGAGPGPYGVRVLARAASGSSMTPSSPAAVLAPAAAITAQARAQLDAWRSGKIDRTVYDAAANALVTAAVIAQVRTALSALGELKTFAYVRTVNHNGVTAYVYRFTAAKPPTLTETIGFDPDGKIAGILFQPEMP